MNLLYSGLQRSGTNFLETLLKKKYRVRFLNSNKDRNSVLHKHFRLYDDKEIIPEPQYRNELKIADFESYEQLFDVAPDYYLVLGLLPLITIFSNTTCSMGNGWNFPSKLKKLYFADILIYYRMLMKS